jgi:type II secretory pathway component GspD/PulD (secretin)
MTKKCNVLSLNCFRAAFAAAVMLAVIVVTSACFAAERFSLDFNGVEIAEAVKVFSMKSGLTAVPTKKVTGRVSVYLHEVTADDAIKVLAASVGCAYAKQGTVVTFMSLEEYRAQFGREYGESRVQKEFVCANAEAEAASKILESLKSEIGKVMVHKTTGTIVVFDTPQAVARMTAALAQIDRAPQSDVLQLDNALAPKVKEELAAMFEKSSATAVADERSGTLVVTGSAQQRAQLKTIIDAFDIARKQVEIQSAIVQVTVTDAQRRGVDWQKIFKGVDDLKVESTFSPALTSGRGQISVGSLSSDDYSAVLQLLATQGEVKTDTNPRLVVLDKEEAKLHVGVREPIITVKSDTDLSASATVVKSDIVEYVDVGVNLFVAPIIGSDGYVTMKIKPEINRVTDTVTTTAGSIIPKVETSLIETTVKVKSGRTLMISGLVKKTDERNEQGLPWLHTAPFVGWMFGHKEETKTSTEFVVFLTPQIIRGDETVAKKISEVRDAHL